MDAYAEDKGYFDLVFECSRGAGCRALGHPSRSDRLVRIVQVGVTGDLPVPINLIVGKEVELKGTHRFHAEFAEAVRLIDSHAIDVKPIITGTYPLERAIEAFDTAGDRTRSVKVHLTFN